MRAPSGASIRAPSSQGVPGGGPIQIGTGSHAEQMVQVAWNAQHEVPWHWPVPAYLVTKGVGAGAFAAMALLALLSSAWSMTTFLGVGGIGLLMTAATTGLSTRFASKRHCSSRASTGGSPRAAAPAART